jgi:HK97 family phage major capsid protein
MTSATPRHEQEVLLNNILHEMRSATSLIDQRDQATRSRLGHLEASVNDLMRQMGRPRGGNGSPDVDERKSALEMLQQRHHYTQTKHDAMLPEPSFSEDQIAESKLAIRGLRTLMHSTSIDQVPLDQRKALSSFSFGSSGFILAPEMSNEILSCLEDITDIAGIMRNITISGPSIRFMVDNELFDVAAWACDSSCFANNPSAQIGQGIGEVEIKPESLRYIVCTTRELLEDASANVEAWLLEKANMAFRALINHAILTGDGFGKPQGILNPSSGIPIMDTAASTPPNYFTWQDLIMLRFAVPMSLQANAGAYLMNQYTWALCSTMSDSNGRPIMTASPTEGAAFLLGGVPVIIAPGMPDVHPGATPVAFGNWNRAYMVVNRKGITMQMDPFSGGFCPLFRFEARVGGATVCPNAARLLRIR